MSVQSANLTVGDLKDLSGREVGHVYMATTGAPSENNVLLDCGATSHMFREHRRFGSYIPSAGDETVSIGDNRSLTVAGQGTITLKTKLLDRVQTVTLRDVLHVPRLVTNLVSLGKPQHEGATFCSSSEGLVVSLNGEVLLETVLTGALYYINQNANEVSFTTILGGSLHLWHRHMGHLHIDAIRKLVQKEMVKGLTILSKNHDHVCEGCVLGKSHRLPFPEASQTTYEHMELIVVDLAGPMSVETWSGMSYVFMAVEASTRMGVAELMV
jgi:hypothetical protein